MGFPGLRYVPSEQANQGGKGGDKSRVDVAIFSTAVEREASNRQATRNWCCSAWASRRSFSGGN